MAELQFRRKEFRSSRDNKTPYRDKKGLELVILLCGGRGGWPGQYQVKIGAMGGIEQ